jgi:peptidoglycan hydrolase-like protein with peptidoglycan-binding domain
MGFNRMTRKYTGFDGNAPGKRAGTERLIDLIEEWTDNALWNNGSWAGYRSKRGKPGNPSVHNTGRAFDLSWRDMGKRGSGNYADAEKVMELLTHPTYAQQLGIEAVFDYWNKHGKHGRGWKCDRGQWRIYKVKVFAGVPGDWIHCEVSPTVADDPAYIERVWKEITGDKPAPKTPPNQQRPYPGRMLRFGSSGDDVKWIQTKVGATPDGLYGRKTRAAVKAWQRRYKVRPYDGIVGKITWAALNRVN